MVSSYHLPLSTGNKTKVPEAKELESFLGLPFLFSFWLLGGWGPGGNAWLGLSSLVAAVVNSGSGARTNRGGGMLGKLLGPVDPVDGGWFCKAIIMDSMPASIGILGVGPAGLIGAFGSGFTAERPGDPDSFLNTMLTKPDCPPCHMVCDEP